MKPTSAILGVAAIAAVFIASFYAYSHLAGKRADSLPSQTAVMDTDSDSGALGGRGTGDEKVAVRSSSTALPPPSLEGFNENQLQEGLENIKAGLDFLTDPIE